MNRAPIVPTDDQISAVEPVPKGSHFLRLRESQMLAKLPDKALTAWAKKRFFRISETTAFYYRLNAQKFILRLPKEIK